MLKSIATVGGFTAASRVLGFLRDILIARMLGTGFEADAFFVALRIPNLFRRLLAEGAFNAAFIPLHTRAAGERGASGAQRFAEDTLALMITTLLAITLAALLAMPWLIALIAPGFLGTEEKFAAAVRFTRLTCPYLLLMGMVSVYAGVLNAGRRFAHVAAAPLLFNIVMITALIAVVPVAGHRASVLSAAVTVAGMVQFLWLVLAAAAAGWQLALPLPSFTPPMRRLIRLMVPGLLGSGAMQINLLVGTMVASLAPGAVSFLYYADRIYQLPLGVIGVAIGVVLLPELARHLRAGQPLAARESLNRGIEFALLIALPATVALLTIPHTIIGVLFERGAFGKEATAASAAALRAFATGLPAYLLAKTIAPAFYAREDTATPFRYAIIAMAANTGLSLALFPLIGFVGVALATSLAAWLDLALLSSRLVRDRIFVPDLGLKRRATGMVAASIAMGAALATGNSLMAPALAEPGMAKVGALVLLVAGGMLLYFGFALLAGAIAWTRLVAILRRDRQGAAAPVP